MSGYSQSKLLVHNVHTFVWEYYKLNLCVDLMQVLIMTKISLIFFSHFMKLLLFMQIFLSIIRKSSLVKFR